MQVTLRRAARLLSQVDAKITELSNQLYESPVKSIFVGDANDTVARRLADARTLGVSAGENVFALIDARTTLRGLVGRANADSGVNDLVTTLKGTDLKLSTVRNLRGRAGTEPALTENERNVRLTVLREQAAGGKTSIRGYHDASDNLTPFQTYSQADLDEFASTEKDLLKKLEATQDQIERINNTITFEVPAEVESTLKTTNVL